MPGELKILVFSPGPDGLPVDRRDYDSAEGRGLDTSSGQTRGGLLLDQGRPLDLVGGGHEGKMSRRAWHFDRRGARASARGCRSALALIV